MKNAYKVLFIVVVAMMFLVPSYSVKAVNENNVPTATNVGDAAKKSTNGQDITKATPTTSGSNNSGSKKSCKYILGNPNNPDSFAFMIQKVLNYVKIIAPILVILLSGFDFTKNALSGDDDEMKKALKKLGIRLACAAGVYLAPLLTGFILKLINDSSVDSTCIK